MKDYKKFAQKCYNSLLSEQEWVERYAGYANDLYRIKAIYFKKRRKFHVPSYISCYTGISMATQRTAFDLRFCGQSIGIITIKYNADGKKVMLQTKANKKGNGYYFDWTKEEKCDWQKSETAKEFRAHFKKLAENLYDIIVKSPEHKMENLLLREFAKTSGADKKLLHIQPVRLFKNGEFFQMPTPFNASKHEVKYAAEKGGGIDIMARVFHKTGSAPRLCIFELKDENKSSEPQCEVLLQAIEYAIFIAHLLKNPKTGNNWWKIFGYSSEEVPTDLHIDVATLMPNTLPDELETEEMLNLPNGVTLHLHTLFYDEKTGEFTGTLKDDLRSCK